MGLFSKKDKHARTTASAASSTATDALREIMAVKAQLEAMQMHDSWRENAESVEYQRQMREAELLAQELLSDLTEEEREIAADNDISIAVEMINTNPSENDTEGKDAGKSVEELAENIRNILNQVQGLDEATEEDMQELAKMLAESMVNLTDEELQTIYDILEETSPEFVALLKEAVIQAKAKATEGIDGSANNESLLDPIPGIFWQKRAFELQTKLIEGQKSHPRMVLGEQEKLIKELSGAMIKAEL